MGYSSLRRQKMKTALVFAAKGSEEIECLAPVDFLRRAGADVKLIGLDGREIAFSHGVKVICDAALPDVANETPSLIVLPGGLEGAANFYASPELKELVSKQLAEGRLLGAICATPAHVLSKWGLLEGRKWTCYPGCESATDKISEERVVKDGNLITARGPGVSLEFAASLVEALCGKEAADKVVAGTLTVLR